MIPGDAGALQLPQNRAPKLQSRRAASPGDMGHSLLGEAGIQRGMLRSVDGLNAAGRKKKEPQIQSATFG